MELEHSHIIKILDRRTAVLSYAVLNFLYRFGKVNVYAEAVFCGFLHYKLKIAPVGSIDSVRAHHEFKTLVVAVGTHIVQRILNSCLSALVISAVSYKTS